LVITKDIKEIKYYWEVKRRIDMFGLNEIRKINKTVIKEDSKMKILEAVELYLNAAIKEKSLKQFKKEFPVKTIDVTTLLDKSVNKFELTQTTDKANQEYRRIELDITRRILAKLIKTIVE